MEKTIKQWLEEGLTEDQYGNAVYNNNPILPLNNIVSSLSEAIKCGFRWGFMPEGYEYWECKYYEILEREQSSF